MIKTPKSLSLIDRAGRAVGLNLCGNLASVLLALGLGIVLARLLRPSEFGMYGVGLGIVTIAEVIGSCGMLQAIVQRKNLTPEDETAGMFLQTSGALVLGTGLLLSGPAFQRFFQMPGLASLVQLQSAVLLANALGLVPTSRLTRRLHFGRLAIVEISARSFGGLISILLAFKGHGALALTFGSIVTGTLRSAGAWMLAPGRIAVALRLQSIKNLLGFGTGVLLIRICNDFAHRVDVLIIGRQLGAELVGLYQRAFQLVTIPLYQITNAANQVLFSTMSKIQDDDCRFRKGYLGTLGLSTIAAFPVLTVLWTTSDLLVPLLYGPMWRGAVPILSSLAIVGFLRIANNPNGLVTQARAQVMAEAMRQTAFMVSIALFVFIGTFFGVQGVVVGIGLASLVFLVMMTRLALRVSGVSFKQWLSALRSAIIGSTAMGATALGVKFLLFGRLPVVPLLATVVCGAVLVYLVSLRLCLTMDERHILEALLTILPTPLKKLLEFFLGSARGSETHRQSGGSSVRSEESLVKLK